MASSACSACDFRRSMFLSMRGFAFDFDEDLLAHESGCAQPLIVRDKLLIEVTLSQFEVALLLSKAISAARRGSCF